MAALSGSTTFRNSGDWRIGDPVIAETTVYPRCQLARESSSSAHDFTDAEDHRSGQVYLYCRQCGLVQKLEVTD